MQAVGFKLRLAYIKKKSTEPYQIKNVISINQILLAFRK
tara:strand:+ start:502 stop:618 length:117 start_codon:yes stop_codon:yes gene_type:complete